MFHYRYSQVNDTSKYIISLFSQDVVLVVFFFFFFFFLLQFQGGIQAGPALTAYVLISLLGNEDIELAESFKQKINTSAAKALGYLEAKISSLTDSYVLAIASYALKLAKSSAFATAFAKLNNDAIVKGNIYIMLRKQSIHCQFVAASGLRMRLHAIKTSLSSPSPAPLLLPTFFCLFFFFCCAFPGSSIAFLFSV